MNERPQTTPPGTSDAHEARYRETRERLRVAEARLSEAAIPYREAAREVEALRNELREMGEG
jgi:hypothetical protein